MHHGSEGTRSSSPTIDLKQNITEKLVEHLSRDLEPSFSKKDYYDHTISNSIIKTMRDQCSINAGKPRNKIRPPTQILGGMILIRIFNMFLLQSCTFNASKNAINVLHFCK
jgi:hypothetical protein